MLRKAIAEETSARGQDQIASANRVRNAIGVGLPVRTTWTCKDKRSHFGTARQQPWFVPRDEVEVGVGPLAAQPFDHDSIDGPVADVVIVGEVVPRIDQDPQGNGTPGSETRGL